jgi:hypothetical protein
METIVGRVISIMANVRVDDVQIHYEVIGEGFPLIMIMGLGANVDWWDPRMILELSKKFKVVMFDNRGPDELTYRIDHTLSNCLLTTHQIS